MSDVVKMIEERRVRNETSFEDYARAMDVKTSVLYKYVKQAGERDMSVPNLKKIVQFYKSQNDVEMVAALVDYATGVKLSSSP